MDQLLIITDAKCNYIERKIIYNELSAIA